MKASALFPVMRVFALPWRRLLLCAVLVRHDASITSDIERQKSLDQGL
jgi:hypothetical protein